MASPALIIPVLPLLNEQNKLPVALPIFVSTFRFETEEAFERLRFFSLVNGAILQSLSSISIVL